MPIIAMEFRLTFEEQKLGLGQSALIVLLNEFRCQIQALRNTHIQRETTVT